MVKIQLRTNHVIVASAIGSILLLILLISRQNPHQAQMKQAKSLVVMQKLDNLQRQVKQLLRNELSPTFPDNETPRASLGYVVSSPLIWDRRKDYRDSQVEQFNKVPLGSERGPLKKFFQEHWEPTFSCPFPTRLGNIGDGGKWVCNPEELLTAAKAEGRKVLVYSLGSNSEYSFETSINEQFKGNVEIHTFDMGRPRVVVPHFINFHMWKMVGDSEDMVGIGRSLKTIRKTLGHIGKTIDIFKIDIEGSEYEVLKPLMTPQRGCLLNANIVLMETHWGSPREYNDLFQRLTTICGMELYYKEPNIEYSSGEVLEWCFVKVNWDTIPRS